MKSFIKQSFAIGDKNKKPEIKLNFILIIFPTSEIQWALPTDVFVE